jgi:hypothetical protein
MNQYDDYLIAYHDSNEWIFLDMQNAILDTGYPHDETLERYAQMKSAYNHEYIYATFRHKNLSQPVVMFYKGVKYD